LPQLNTLSACKFVRDERVCVRERVRKIEKGRERKRKEYIVRKIDKQIEVVILGKRERKELLKETRVDKPSNIKGQRL